MNVKLEHFGKQIMNNWKFVKCGAGERWTDRVRNSEVLRRVKKKKIILSRIKMKGRLNRLGTSCVETAF